MGASFSWPDVVRQPAAVHAHAAAEHQRVDAGAVHQVVVVPVVDAGADDDRALAAGEPRGLAPLAREADQRVAAHAGVLLRPRRRVGRVLVVVVRRVVARQAARHAVLRHQQVVDGGRRVTVSPSAVSMRFTGTPRVSGAPSPKSSKRTCDDVVGVVEERRARDRCPLPSSAVLAAAGSTCPSPSPQRKPDAAHGHLGAGFARRPTSGTSSRRSRRLGSRPAGSARSSLAGVAARHRAPRVSTR